MEEKRENPDATVNSIRKVVTVKHVNCPLANQLIKSGWILLKVTDDYYVLGHQDEVSIPRLLVQ